MGDLSKNLSRYEMICGCGCGFDTVDAELVDALQDACDALGVVNGDLYLIITGPNRCTTHNTTLRELYDHTNGEDGAKTSSNSQHQYGRAADFKLFKRGSDQQIKPNEVATYLEMRYTGKYGIGRYSTRTHIDTRTGGAARWDG